MKKFIKVVLVVIILVSFCLSLFASPTSRIIKVGYIGYEGFISPNEKGEMVGYGVEYLNKIAEFTDYKYDYVYGTWKENLIKLKNHEIDLVCTAKLTAERFETFTFSKHPFGLVQGVVYSASDSDLYYDDFIGLNGQKIAFLKDSLNYQIFTKHAQENGFTFIPVFFNSDKEMTAALENNEVLAIVTEHMVAHNDLKLICKFDNQPFYLMSYKNCNFMGSIDSAMGQLLTENVNYQVDLFNKYYGEDKAIRDPHFTREEVSFIKELLAYKRETTGVAALKMPITIGQNPLAYLDEEGKIHGIYYDLLREIARISGIAFDFVPLEPRDIVYDYNYFRDNGFDLMMLDDNAINRGYETFRASGMRFTKPIDDFRKVIVAKKGFQPDLNSNYTIAYIGSSQTTQKLLKAWYPDSVLVPYNNIEECFEAVKDGKADILIYNQYLTERQLLRPQFSSLSVVPYMSFSDSSMLSPIIFKNGSYKEIGEKAADPYLDNPLLISVLDKAIEAISDQTIRSVVINNTIGTYSEHLSWNDFVYKYKYFITIISIISLALLFALLLLNILKQRNLKKLSAFNKELAYSVDKAEAATKAKSQFLSRMSHEIRTPMNAIVGLTAIAKNHLDESDKVEEYLTKIDSSSKVLLNIINDVLDMSAIESNKIKISNTEFDLKTILDSISDIYYTQCLQKNIKYSMSVDVEHEYLIGDSLRVNQILLNLISNAYKFTPEGGQITIKVTEMNSVNNKAFIKFIVSDTGIGITDGMKERLFKPFEQENSETVQKYGGSGLGLSITKNLVEMMQGVICVESTLGKGTTFTIDLPFDICDIKLVQNYNKLKDLNILVVDDDKNVLEYTSVILQRLGINYTLANSGLAALEKIEDANYLDKKFDACFIDWKMPEMNGLELVKKIKATYKDTLVVIVSAYDLSQMQEEAKQSGVDYFISKPLYQSTIFNVLLSLTGGKVQIKPLNKINYDFEGAKVLLAEDNEMNTEIAVDLLELVNIQVDTAENGEIALAKFEKSKENEYFAILMDVQMPIMNGYEATRRIRSCSHVQAKVIPIIAMTANAFTEDITSSLSVGMNSHISKPIDTQVLYKTLKDAQGGKL